MFQILVDALSSRCFVVPSTNMNGLHDFHDFGLPVAKRCHILFITINIVFLPTRHFEQDTPDRAPVTMKLNALNACPLASRSILRRRNVRYKLCAVFMRVSNSAVVSMTAIYNQLIALYKRMRKLPGSKST